MGKYNHYEAVTKDITDRMENNEIPWQKPWITQGMAGQCNANSKRPYTGLNALVLAMGADILGVKSPYWLTAKKAFSMGLQLPKGSKGVKVLGWFPPKRTNQETGETEEGRGLYCKSYTLFNVDQFVIPEGIKLPKHFTEKPEPKEALFPLLDEAEEIIANTGADITFGSQAAYYVPMRDKVFMPAKEAFSEQAEFYSTLFHELTHWTGHEARLKRFKNTDKQAFRSEEYSAEELCAEMGSVFVCSKLNISSESSMRNSAAYLQGWLKFIKSDPKAFVFACQRAQKASDYIFNAKAESKVG